MSKFLFKKGHKHSAETKKKLSLLKMGKNNPMYGKKFSNSHKHKLSIAGKRQLKDGNNNWKGGIIKTGKYLKEYTSKQKYTLLHRAIVERFIGRKLLSSEIVHHIDENTSNNDISNLEIMSRAKHASIHHKK
jgi:hypothetical protein